MGRGSGAPVSGDPVAQFKGSPPTWRVARRCPTGRGIHVWSSLGAPGAFSVTGWIPFSAPLRGSRSLVAIVSPFPARLQVRRVLVAILLQDELDSHAYTFRRCLPWEFRRWASQPRLVVGGWFATCCWGLVLMNLFLPLAVDGSGRRRDYGRQAASRRQEPPPRQGARNCG